MKVMMSGLSRRRKLLPSTSIVHVVLQSLEIGQELDQAFVQGLERAVVLAEQLAVGLEADERVVAVDRVRSEVLEQTTSELAAVGRVAGVGVVLFEHRHQVLVVRRRQDTHAQEHVVVKDRCPVDALGRDAHAILARDDAEEELLDRLDKDPIRVALLGLGRNGERERVVKVVGQIVLVVALRALALFHELVLFHQEPLGSRSILFELPIFCTANKWLARQKQGKASCSNEPSIILQISYCLEMQAATYGETPLADCSMGSALYWSRYRVVLLRRARTATSNGVSRRLHAHTRTHVSQRWWLIDGDWEYETRTCF